MLFAITDCFTIIFVIDLNWLTDFTLHMPLIDY